MSAIKHKLIHEFNDKEYAHAYMDAHLIDRISTQIYQLRLQRGLTQQRLSEISGIAQERISLLESGDFSSITMKTLRKLAEAFDVAISIKFESFADAIEDFVNLNIDALQVEDRLSSLKKLKDSNQTSTKINMGDNWKIHHFSDRTIIAGHMLKSILSRHNITVGEVSINQSHQHLASQFENFTINVVENS